MDIIPKREEIDDDHSSVSNNSETKGKKKYSVISQEVRQKFIQRVLSREVTIKEAAKEFDIKFSTSKAILQTFKKEGRIGKKKTRQRKPKAIKQLEQQQKQQHQMLQQGVYNPTNSLIRKEMGVLDEKNNQFGRMLLDQEVQNNIYEINNTLKLNKYPQSSQLDRLKFPSIVNSQHQTPQTPQQTGLPFPGSPQPNTTPNNNGIQQTQLPQQQQQQQQPQFKQNSPSQSAAATGSIFNQLNKNTQSIIQQQQQQQQQKQQQQQQQQLDQPDQQKQNSSKLVAKDAEQLFPNPWSPQQYLDKSILNEQNTNNEITQNVSNIDMDSLKNQVNLINVKQLLQQNFSNGNNQQQSNQQNNNNINNIVYDEDAGRLKDENFNYNKYFDNIQFNPQEIF